MVDIYNINNNKPNVGYIYIYIYKNTLDLIWLIGNLKMAVAHGILQNNGLNTYCNILIHSMSLSPFKVKVEY